MHFNSIKLNNLITRASQINKCLSDARNATEKANEKLNDNCVVSTVKRGGRFVSALEDFDDEIEHVQSQLIQSFRVLNLSRFFETLERRMRDRSGGFSV